MQNSIAIRKIQLEFKIDSNSTQLEIELKTKKGKKN